MQTIFYFHFVDFDLFCNFYNNFLYKTLEDSGKQI